MSLSKLGYFIKEKYQWRSVNLRQSTVVIKGDSLCYHLYFNNYRWQNGGNYYEFYSYLVEFFRMLEAQKTRAYVVMNGADTSAVVYKERCSQRLQYVTDIRTSHMNSVRKSVLPLFAKTVFVDAMRDCRISFFIADGDGDPDCVAVANHNHCPILGDDTDFFVFNIDEGYIPLYDSEGSLIDFEGTVKCYNYKAFDSQMECSSAHRLQLALVLESRKSLMTRRKGVCDDIEDLLDNIKDEPLDLARYRLINDKTHPYYRVVPRSFWARTTTLDRLNSKIPCWILSEYKLGMFNQSMMQLLVRESTWRYSNVIEDTRQRSAWSVTFKPRRYIIGVLSQLLRYKDHIKDTERTGVPCNLTLSRVQLKEKHNQVLPVPLKDILSIDITERQRILVKCFDCKHIQVSLDKIPIDLKLAVITCRVWLKSNDQAFASFLLPLVFCILACSGKYPMPEDIKLSDHVDMERLHSFAQWQCVLHHGIALNQLLGNAFRYISPARLFSCDVVEHFCVNPPPQPLQELPSVMISVITKQ